MKNLKLCFTAPFVVVGIFAVILAKVHALDDVLKFLVRNSDNLMARTGPTLDNVTFSAEQIATNAPYRGVSNIDASLSAETPLPRVPFTTFDSSLESTGNREISVNRDWASEEAPADVHKTGEFKTENAGVWSDRIEFVSRTGANKVVGTVLRHLPSPQLASEQPVTIDSTMIINAVPILKEAFENVYGREGNVWESNNTWQFKQSLDSLRINNRTFPITPGSDWRETILDRCGNCRTFVLVAHSEDAGPNSRTFILPNGQKVRLEDLREFCRKEGRNGVFFTCHTPDLERSGPLDLGDSLYLLSKLEEHLLREPGGTTPAELTQELGRHLIRHRKYQTGRNVAVFVSAASGVGYTAYSLHKD